MEIEFVLCITKREMPVPPVPSDSVTCAKCGIELWRSKASPREAGSICYACVRTAEDKPLIVVTRAILEDVIRYSQTNQDN